MSAREPTLDEAYGVPVRVGGGVEYVSIHHFCHAHGRSNNATTWHRKLGRTFEEIADLWRVRDGRDQHSGDGRPAG